MQSHEQSTDRPGGDDPKQVIASFIALLVTINSEMNNHIVDMNAKGINADDISAMSGYYQQVGMNFYEYASMWGSDYFDVVQKSKNLVDLVDRISKMAYEIADEMDGCDGNVHYLRLARAIHKIKVEISNLMMILRVNQNK